MKYFVFIVAFNFLFLTGAYPQRDKINYNLKIDYDINNNVEIPNTEKGSLYIDSTNTKSLFIYGKNKDRRIEQDPDDNMTFNIRNRKIIRFNYLDLVVDSLYSKENSYNNDIFIIEEVIPDLKWKLINEEKTIDSIQVKKALLNFRGRNYIAWYSTEYPIRFGPWKFHGLPGLIIEIYDETKRYHWLVSKIKKENRTSSADIEPLTKKAQRVTIKEYVDKLENTPFFNTSGLPRGVEITIRKSPRKGIEIKYAWEKETKED